MPQSPFPGMDPYLEAPDMWPDVHERLITIFAEQLAPNLAPSYVAELNTQIVIDRVFDGPSEEKIMLPDVTVAQAPENFGGVAVAAPPIAPAPLRLFAPMNVPTRLVCAYIRLRETNRLVTVIKLLSPVNKRPGGSGRREYLEKRNAYFDAPAHLVEIDLLRQWPRMPLEGVLPKSDYLAIVCKMHERRACDVWPISVQHPLPVLPIPLLDPDPPVPLDMGQALRTAYQRARYDLRIDYSKPPTPLLAPEDRAWAEGLVAQNISSQ
ncbi:MAG TPA: DUF4058 family protein [Chloroflexi bacterium]|nr:DUF4058 family protein [Chloroflexota bacterium]